MSQLNDNIKTLANSSLSDVLLECLDGVMDHVADARNGEWTTETRKASIEAIQEVLYNKIKTYRDRDNKTVGNDEMI